MKKKIAISAAIVLLVFFSLAGVKTLQVRTLMAAGKAFVPPPESVSSAVAHQEKWQTSLHTIGTITAAQGVTISPEIAGTVSEIAFDSGAVVAKGDLLVRLDTSSEEAQLRSIEAQAELARLNAERTRKLREENAISQADLDAAEATLKQTQAEADNIRATIAKKTLRAPFSGRLGIRQINLGQYIDKDKPVVSLQSVSPMYCDFTLPQQEISKLSMGLRVRLTSDTYPDKQFEGILSASNPDLDSVTRSVRLQATFDNQDQLLRPGMFTRVEVLMPEEQTVLAIPSTSVLKAPYGDSVFVIEQQPAKDGKPESLVIRQQLVRIGDSNGQSVSVEAGLKPGERVVSAGLFKLRNGMTVVENNELKPENSKTTPPSDS